MSEAPLRAEMARMESEISALVSECDLPLQDANAVRAYLEHEELGVALEALCDTLIESEATLSESQLRRLLDAARTMGMLTREPRAWSERMETLLSRTRPG